MLWYRFYSTAVTEGEQKFELKKNLYISYLALIGEMQGVYCLDLGKNDFFHHDLLIYLQMPS